MVLYSSFQNIWSQDISELLNVLEEVKEFLFMCIYIYIYYLLLIVLEIKTNILNMYILIYSIIQ